MFLLIGDYEAAVITLSGETYHVNLETHICGCGVWKDTLIPCSHALAVFARKRMEPEVPAMYSAANYTQYYSVQIPMIDFMSLEKGICSVPAY
jgi:hypothetical protein